MHTFTFSRAADPTTAIAAHAEDPDLAFIAGGTDLIGLMKDHVALPQHVLDINSLPDMSAIEALPDGGLRIGALARMSGVAADVEVRRHYRKPSVRRVWSNPKYGINGGQHHATYALCLLSRRR